MVVDVHCTSSTISSAACTINWFICLLSSRNYKVRILYWKHTVVTGDLCRDLGGYPSNAVATAFVGAEFELEERIVLGAYDDEVE
jgi:hypothetical protein